MSVSYSRRSSSSWECAITLSGSCDGLNTAPDELNERENARLKYGCDGFANEIDEMSWGPRMDPMDCDSPSTAPSAEAMDFRSPVQVR
jgi:hypothetical protein